MMIRTFHSIGQGAFYTEKFDNFSFVYDCGTDTNGEKRINKYVKNHFKKGDVINVLFISHFHRDHINGIKYLLSNYKVDFIFIPQFDVYQHILEFMRTERDVNLFDVKLTLNPIETISSISPKTKVILVNEYSDESEFEEIDLDSLNSNTNINSGTLLKTCVENWNFIPINYNNDINSSTFKENLNNLNVYFKNTDEFIHAWKDKEKRECIVKAFRKLPKNENSMVVYSGPEDNVSYYMHISSDNHYKCPCQRYILSAGCIYFGDYETHDKAWKAISNTLRNYYDLVGVIQIPHHGSSTNYRNEINKNKYTYSVISYGTNNKHGHPGSYTTESILKNEGLLFEVTENPSTRLDFYIRDSKD
ncbi:MBL fold metallo-hydrolase [Providencia sp.]|uniref:MBL fold metallo-hydrolase n=1 Tax=Providencia sp. TaxID=589 RepID=UPI00303167A8